MSRSRHSRKRTRDRALQAPEPSGHPAAPPIRTIPVRLADGAEAIILHQRIEVRPVGPDLDDAFGGRRYVLKEVFE